MKSYVIRVINKATGAHLFSHTNNPNQRVKRLKENILSINGQGTQVFERFLPFVGCKPQDVDFEIYKQVDTLGF
jgi:hypothetical protein